MVANKFAIALFVLGSCTLTASILANVVLFQLSSSYYRELNATRLDPFGLRVYNSQGLTPETHQVQTSQTSQTQTSQTRTIFWGDSRAFAWTPPPGLPEFEFINRGIGSQTTAQVLGRFEGQIAPLLPSTETRARGTDKPGAIAIVQVGVNDLKTIPLFPKLKSEIIANCQANIKEIVDLVQESESTVILTTIFPLGRLPIQRRLVWSPEVATAIEEVNEFIASLAGERVIILNTAAILAGEEGLVKPEYRHDFLHINEAGYAALNEKLKLVLQEL